MYEEYLTTPVSFKQRKKPFRELQKCEECSDQLGRGGKAQETEEKSPAGFPWAKRTLMGISTAIGGDFSSSDRYGNCSRGRAQPTAESARS